jgi:hypothetical protein
LSDQEWRFTDEQGIERSVTTEELRAALRAGTLTPASRVWRKGMDEFTPIAKIPELASPSVRPAPKPPTSLSRPPPRKGSIPPETSAASKRSVPPPLPPRKNNRAAQKTLTGLEPPELMASLGLTRPAASTELAVEPTADGSDADLPAVVAEADFPAVVERPAPAMAGEQPSQPRVSASDLPALTDDGGWAGDGDGAGESWEDQTDLIPKAPSLPSGLKVSPQLTPLALPEVPPDAPVRTTLLGFGKKDSSTGVNAPRPLLKPPIRVPQAAGAPTRSRPPPPLKRSQPPPASAGPKRLSQTLEMEVPNKGERPNVARPQPKPPKLERERPKPPAPPRRTDAPRPPSHSDATRVLSPEEAANPTQDSAPSPAATAALPSHGEAAPEKPGPKTLMSGTAPPDEAPAQAPSGDASEGKMPRRTHTEVLPRVEASPAPAASPARAPLDPEDQTLPKKKKQNRTLEMALEDHGAASMKNPVPSSSVRPPASDASPSSPPSSGGSVEAAAALDSPVQAARRDRSALEIPRRSILVVSAAWVIGLVIFFAVGRVSGLKTAADTPTLRPSLETNLLRITPPEPVSTAAPSEPKGCWVTRQPARWAAKADKSIAFGRRVADGAMELGFAVDDKKAVGLRIDPKTGKAETVFEKESEVAIGRVAPLVPAGSDPSFFVAEKGERSVLPVPGAKPFFVAFTPSEILHGSDPTAIDKRVWSLEGEGAVAAEQAVTVGDRTMLTFRRKNQVVSGFLGADGAAQGDLASIGAPEGAVVGKPRAGTNGAEIAIVYSEKADDADDTVWKLRLARSKSDALPTSAVDFTLPEGGPGGSVIAPDIVGLADGRWLLMWTEGPFESSAIRAQTYSQSMEPIGDPIALSPPAGLYGQALLTTVGNYTTVVFLQAVDDNFELWGAVLRCE